MSREFFEHTCVRRCRILARACKQTPLHEQARAAQRNATTGEKQSKNKTKQKKYAIKRKKKREAKGQPCSLRVCAAAR